MMISWNIRGLNKVGKTIEISSRLKSLNPTTIVLLETRVRKNKALTVRNKLNLNMKYLDNYDKHENGRIWFIWDDSKVMIKHICSTSQLIHCGVYNPNGDFLHWCTAIYALNHLDDRRKLWKDIEDLRVQQADPWCLLGDFNNVLKAEDRIGGRDVTESEYVDLREMMSRVGLYEMDTCGDFFTWTNKQADNTIYSRIDRFLGNLNWLQMHIDSTLKILAPSISDHALMFLSCKDQSSRLRGRFKYRNSLARLNGFHDEVKKNWNLGVHGNPMYKLWTKLSRLQSVLKNLSSPLNGLREKIDEARRNLQQAHEDLCRDRFNVDNINRVKDRTSELLQLNELEDSDLRQKAKINWIRQGDGNNSYFHATIKGRYKHNAIRSLIKEDGSCITSHEDIEEEVLKFYSALLGSSESNLAGLNIPAIRNGNTLNQFQRDMLIGPVSNAEIDTAIKGMDVNKTPGIDGYGVGFFKDAWSIVGSDVREAILDFFLRNRLHKGFNSSVVALIPKHKEAKMIKDFRPISCCSTVYKIISKVLTNRLSKVIDTLVGKNQAAFVPGQQLHDHVLLAFELLRGYERKHGTPKCMLQIDIQKAYDTVHWDALEHILRELGFPDQFIKWIMIAVRSVTYVFNINGRFTRRLEARRGIRQGDPISPLLFILVMEYLNRILSQLDKIPNFNYHSKCEKMKITNLCFADDLLLFSRGDIGSVQIMLDKFNTFLRSMGLHVNPSKCNIYCGSVDINVKEQLLLISGFKEGKMPFRYLGIPLSSKKLNIKHYQVLIDKIVGRITHWSAGLLSYAGRVQLIQSVIFATINFWMQCLPLPKFVIMRINAICRSFLWIGNSNISRKSPIAWEKVCSPKINGGLNIINLAIWNKISILKLLWNVCNKSDNLWIKWLHTYYIRGQSIWSMVLKKSHSWIMSSMMKLRPLLLQYQSRMQDVFKMKKIYLALFEESEKMSWRTLMCNNLARPRALFCLWQACHFRLASKDRLIKFGLNVDANCAFCSSMESHEHLFFGCIELKTIWTAVLNWLQIIHMPSTWSEELNWITRKCKGKGWRAMLLKCAFTETIYHIWAYRNHRVFGGNVNNRKVEDSIINTIIYRVWDRKRYRRYIAELMT